MKILFVDGGNPPSRVRRPYNGAAALEVARLLKALVGNGWGGLVVYSDSEDADRTAYVISTENTWGAARLNNTLRPLHDALTMRKVEELVLGAMRNKQAIVFVVSFTDNRALAMFHLFKILMNSNVDMPDSSVSQASFDVYEVDTREHTVRRFPGTK